MRVKYVFILFLFCIVISCDRENGLFTVSGIVRDHTTKQPIPEATVYLLAHEKDGGIWGGSPSFFIDTTIADANGKFSFAPEKNDDWGYSCMAEKDLYFLGDEYTADGDYALTVTAYLYPKAWLNVHIENVSPINESDYINISWSIDGPFYGVDIDTILVTTLNGNTDNYLTWYITKNSISNTYTEILYLPAFDTTFYEILY